MTDSPAFEPLGDSAVLFRLPGGAVAYPRAQAIAETVSAARLDGLLDATAAYDTFAVYYDPALTPLDGVVEAVLNIVDRLPEAVAVRGDLITVPVAYDGPDLDFVCAATGLSRKQVVELHSAREYSAQAVGFVPGFAYLGDLPERLRLPRRSSPRPRVTAGAVAIASLHTAVYPFATAGGWHLIGSTTTTMFDVTHSPPALITVGTRVRFQPV